jgi:colicin import membrane protein
VAGAPEGRDSTLTASQQALLGVMIKNAVKECWNINTGAEGIEKIVVKVEVVLKPDGRLAQPPRVVNNGPGPLFASTADSAVRAVVQCQPYDFPRELYKGGWDQAVWTFDPQRMF